MRLHAPKAVEKIRELYKKQLSQSQIAEELNSLRKIDRAGFGPTEWTQEKVSLYSRRAGLKAAHKSRGGILKKTKKRQYRKRTGVPFLDVPLQTEISKNSDRVTIIICAPTQLKNIMEELT